MNAFDFFSVSGGFGVEKKAASDIALSDETTADMEVLTIGATDVDAFAGLNGGSDDAVGLSLGSVDFALALMTDMDDSSRRFASLQATADSAAFTGIDDLTLRADSLAVSINQAEGSSAVVDYSGSNAYSVSGGLTLDMDGSRGTLLEASGNVTLSVSDFFGVSGGFSLEKSTSLLTLDDSSVADVDLLTVGTADADAFAGLHGGSANAIGLSLQDASFCFGNCRRSRRSHTHLDFARRIGRRCGVRGRPRRYRLG